ncbi:hypothetical protein [Acinetobacter sp. MD2(2019)]|uniref:hypothetical protein n=1 Tax=Acinetobacter sp. MD2(2019) TaxID=2605273 RepID=UPI002D1F5CCC|nr:hypothetical protein [Acinetobacter sp. MD2(2019)]MEB3754860.1 hypothetical protein [Acinetobacter sp. MD2(2019)]
MVIPLGSMSMFAMLLYVLFEYFFLGDPQELPFWVVILCAFFVLMLMPLIYHIFSKGKLSDTDKSNKK